MKSIAPPAAPPPLKRHGMEGAEKLETERAKAFETVKAALARANGNICEAGRSLGWNRNRITRYVVRFELTAWAASLRLTTTGKTTGRPVGTKRPKGARR